MHDGRHMINVKSGFLAFLRPSAILATTAGPSGDQSLQMCGNVPHVRLPSPLGRRPLGPQPQCREQVRQIDKPLRLAAFVGRERFAPVLLIQ